MKILAVDYGARRVGLASGDSSSRIAFPKGMIERGRKSDDQVVSAILRVCEEEGYEMVVFGLPLDMDGGKGKQYQVTTAFMGRFEKVVRKQGLDLQVTGVDERLSSFEGDAYLDDFKGSGMRKQEGDRDVMAAKVILERYFKEKG